MNTLVTTVTSVAYRKKITLMPRNVVVILMTASEMDVILVTPRRTREDSRFTPRKTIFLSDNVFFFQTVRPLRVKWRLTIRRRYLQRSV